MISIEAEQAALGGVILSGDLDDLQGVSSGDFYDRRHQIIFTALVDLRDKNQPFDPITICDLLNSRKELDDAGGMPYITELSCAPSSANTEAYGKLVADHAKRRQLLGRINEYSQAIQSDKSFDELLSEIQQDLTTLEPKDSQSLSMEETCKEYVNWLERPENKMRSGFWDAHTGGIEAGLHVIAAGTGQGKSTLALNVASNLVSNGFGVGYYSYEMPRMKVMERLVSQRSRVFLGKLRDRNLNDMDYQAIMKAMSKIRSEKLYIHDRVYKLDHLCASIRRGFSKGFIDCAFVDYLQLVPSDAQSREQEVAKVARSLQQVAQQAGKPVFALSQLSREHEKRKSPKPRLSDLRESGEIEQAAETVVFIYDEIKYIEDSRRKELVEIYSGKNRNGDQFELFAKKRMEINVLEPYLGEVPDSAQRSGFRLEV